MILLNLYRSLSQFRFDPRTLRDTTPRQRALYRGAISLVLRRGSRDFFSKDLITRERIVENHIDDHHIFPYAYLEKREVATRLRDSVLNRTLIDRLTNQQISNRAPSEYIRVMQESLGYQELNELLESHLIPAGLDSPVWRNDFEGFLNWRQDRLWREIQSVTGIERPSDLIDEEVTA